MADTVSRLEDESAGLQLYLAKFLAGAVWERWNRVWQLLQAMVRLELP